MNAVTVTPPPPAPAAPQSRAAAVGKALSNSRDRLESVFRNAEDLAKTDWQHLAIGSGLSLSLANPPKPGSHDGERQARGWLEGAPPSDFLRDHIEACEAALTTPIDPGHARLALGLLLDAFPNVGKEPREGYFATLLHEVTDGGVTPHTLAEACRHLRRGAKFLPTVSEVLAACDKAHWNLGHAKSAAERLLRLNEACALVLKAAATDPGQWPDDWWWEAVCDWQRSKWDTERHWNPALGPQPGEVGCRVPAAILATAGITTEAAQ